MSTELKDRGKPVTAALSDEPDQQMYWALFLGLLAVVTLAYYRPLGLVFRSWNDPLYNHGYIIPVFAGVLLYLRRESFQSPTRAAQWTGLGLIAAATLMRLGALRLSFSTLQPATLLPCMLGVVLIVGGWKAMRWAGPAVAFTALMYPLPRRLVTDLLLPMKEWATIGSTGVLQTLGIDAVRVGNRIFIEGGAEPLTVADVCSGLRMATVFLALGVAVALLARHRPWWERLIVVGSALPIAIFANIIRITIIGLVRSFGIEDGWIFHLVHDWAGYFMMPLALGLLYVVLQILANLFIEHQEMRPVPARAHAGRPGPAPRRP